LREDELKQQEKFSKLQRASVSKLTLVKKKIFSSIFLNIKYESSFHTLMVSFLCGAKKKEEENT